MFKRLQNMLEALKHECVKVGDEGTGTTSAASNGGDRIPWKTNTSNEKGKGNGKGKGKGDRHCKHCEAKVPAWAQMHNSKECHHWDKDLNPKSYCAKKLVNSANPSETKRELKNGFDQMHKDNERLLKALK